MSENTNDQEKTESPSSKRLEDARKNGQIPRSKEFATFAVLAMSFGSAAAFAPWLIDRFESLLKVGLKIPQAAGHDIPAMFDFFRTVVSAGWIIGTPILLAAILAAAIGPLATNSYVFLPDKLAPDLAKLNPVKWLSRVLSKEGLMEVGKGVLKATMISLVAYYAYASSMERMMNAPGMGLEGGMVEASMVLVRVIGFVLVALAALAAADVPLQLWMHHTKLKMTLQELKDESKESDGNPEIKGRIKRAQREMARRRMIDDVKKSDVVITNPTHYAVALSYKDGAMGAPVMLAKGVDELALRIREAAKEAGVPIVESPKLARAIYASTELEREIPETIFMAVAQVLTYAFAIKAFEARGGARPQLADVTVPDNMDPHYKAK